MHADPLACLPMVYLDNNATTQPAPEVVEAVSRMLGVQWGNPSSIHRFGQQARREVDLAREKTCALIGCNPKELVFTSGATESNNTAIRGILDACPTKKTVITTRLEHSAIREPCTRLKKLGYRIIDLPVNVQGLVNCRVLESSLREHAADTALVAIHFANNETGTLQPIEHIGTLCRDHRVPFFTDATQVVGKIKVNFSELPVDSASFSAHKFHGPKGVGGLFVRSRIRFVPQQLGGPHERERRGGTENTPGIVGMGVASELAMRFIETTGPEAGQRLRNRLESALIQALPDAVVNSQHAPRLWNTTNIGFAPLESEGILILLSERGVYAAAGAACSSGSLEPSPVLLAQGIPEPVAHGSVRFSLSRYTTDREIEQAIEIIPQAISKLRASMPT